MKSRINIKSKTHDLTSYRKSKRYRKHSKRGGGIEQNCLADKTKFPKCGQEGCVYLDDDINNVTKNQWKTNRQMEQHMFSIEGQTEAAKLALAPNIVSSDVKACDLISKIGSENKAPCFVKRHRYTRDKERIIYEEEKRQNWCRNYGQEKNQCVVDEQMYNNFKETFPKISYVFERDSNPNNIKRHFPSLNESLLGDVDDDDDEYGDLITHVDIPEQFTNINPAFLTKIKMSRIKGITIGEFIQEMIEKIGETATKSVAKEWETEQSILIDKVNKIGYNSSDFHEGNIMIDVDDERLCSWIIETLEKTQKPITPSDIKKEFGKENILKIVDWGVLYRFS